MSKPTKENRKYKVKGKAAPPIQPRKKIPKKVIPGLKNNKSKTKAPPIDPIGRIILPSAVISELKELGKQIALRENRRSISLSEIIKILIKEYKSNFRIINGE